MASMICDIGGGTTEVAILSLGDAVMSRSIRIGGDEMDEAIVEYMKQHFSLRIGEQSAEQLKLEIGSAFPLDQELTSEVSGLDTISGVPRKAIVTSEEIREALRDPLEAVLNCIKNVIEQCKPELVADLADNGLVLAGGGSLLRRTRPDDERAIGNSGPCDRRPINVCCTWNGDLPGTLGANGETASTTAIPICDVQRPGRTIIRPTSQSALESDAQPAQAETESSHVIQPTSCTDCPHECPLSLRAGANPRAAIDRR